MQKFKKINKNKTYKYHATERELKRQTSPKALNSQKNKEIVSQNLQNIRQFLPIWLGQIPGNKSSKILNLEHKVYQHAINSKSHSTLAALRTKDNLYILIPTEGETTFFPAPENNPGRNIKLIQYKYRRNMHSLQLAIYLLSAFLGLINKLDAKGLYLEAYILSAFQAQFSSIAHCP